MPLALAASDAGHDVVVATGAPFLGRLPLPTAAAAAGVGRGLPDVLAEPAGTIRAVAEALLCDAAGRDAVRELAAEIAAMPAPADVVRTLFSS
jgi:hypothetical protein